jgi:hypothetical protein
MNTISNQSPQKALINEPSGASSIEPPKLEDKRSVRFDAAHGDYLVVHNRVKTRAIKEPAPWTAVEKFGYSVHSLVWWSRRISGEKSRTADAHAVAEFLQSKHLWTEGMPIARISSGVLRRLDIERHFWWINEEQIVSLATTVSAYAARNPKGSSEEFSTLVHAALFGRQFLSL